VKGTTGSFRIALNKSLTSCFHVTRTIAIAALLSIVCPPVVPSVEPAIGTVTALRGTAFIKRPGAGDPLPARVGMSFLVGDLVETRSGSMARLSLTDESFMNLAAGSAVRVNQYSFDPAENRRTTIIRVLDGKVRFVVFRLRTGGSSFRVEAGNALGTAGGRADFIVAVSTGQAEFTVMDHGLSVRNSLPYIIGDVRVGVNQRTVVKEKAPPTVSEVITPQERKEYLKDLKQIENAGVKGT
jgi:hypothetical protein